MLSKPVAQGCEHCVFQVNSLRLGRSARCNARVRAQADGARIDVSDLYLFANLIELAGAALGRSSEREDHRRLRYPPDVCFAM